MIWLIWSVFLPGSRAALVATNNASDAVVGGSQLAEPDYLHASVEARGLKQMRGSKVQPLAENNLPWILGGIIAVTVVSLACHMMPGLGGGSRTENFNYRIPPAWSPENDSNYSFQAYMTDISLWVMLTDLAPNQQCAAIIMRLG